MHRMQATSSIDFSDKFPIEVLDLILGQLTHRELKSSCLVSKNWNLMISNSRVFLNSTKRNFTVEGRSAARCGMKFDRNYKHLKLGQKWWTGVKLDNTHVDSLMKFSENLTHINMEKVVVKKDGLKNFLKFLHSCEALKELHLFQCKTEYRHPVDRYQTSLASSLCKVTVISSDWLLAHLECKNLELLKIVRNLKPPFNEASKPGDPICRFLSKLSKLHELVLENVDMDSEEIELSPNFMWNKLKYDADESPKFSDRNNRRVNWKNFMESSNKEAEVIINFKLISGATVEFMNVITDYSNVTKLEIRSSVDVPFARDVFQFNDLEKNSKIKFLKIGMIIDLERTKHLENFLSCYPNVEYLDLEMDLFRNITLQNIDKLLKNLRLLKVTMLHEKNIKFILPNLKTFEIRSVFHQDLEMLEIVGENNPQISTLRIYGFGNNNNFNQQSIFGRLSDLMPQVDRFEICNGAVEPDERKMLVKTKAQIQEMGDSDSD